jgi:hypothetical protein
VKAVVASLWILSLAAVFGLARAGDPGTQASGREAAEAFREALEERDPLTRTYQLSAFLEGLTPDQVPEALEALEAHQVGVTPEEIRLLMLAWSRFDAPGAFAWARDWPTRWSDTLTGEALFAWGFRDGRAALAALEGTGDPDLVTRMRSSVVEGWLRSGDRVSTSEYVASVSEPRRRSRLTFVLAGETMKDGVDAVFAWVEAVPENAPNDFKQGAFYHASNVVASEAPLRAAQWFEKHQAHPYSAGSLDAIARKWAQRHDPLALFEWLRGLQGEGDRASEPRDATAAGFQMWRRRAPEEAEEWLLAELPDPGLDGAVAEVVRARAQTAPASAIEWAERIDDDKERRQSLWLAGRMWQRQDPEAAGVWLAQSGLPEELQQSIRRIPPSIAHRRAPPSRPASGSQ